MNQMTRHSLRLSLIVLVGASLYLGGCGPEGSDELSSVESADELNNNAADMTAEDKMPMKDEEEGDDKGEEMQPAPAARPVVSAAPVAVAAVVAPIPVVKLPPAFVATPGAVINKPPIITHSGEDRIFERDIFHERKVFENQPMINRHLIKNNYRDNNIFHTTVHQSSNQFNEVSAVSTYARSERVLPTTVVVTPTLVAPPVIAPIPVPIPYGIAPGCAPYLSGGFWRNCRGPGGPFFR